MTYSSGLWQVIEALLGLGVVVVAAAGNFATSRGSTRRRSRLPVPAGQVPVISVGALNPNGSKALFSDDGRWVTAWAAGAAVVSTYPDRRQRQPHSRTQDAAHPASQPADAAARHREALDPDDFRGGFADLERHLVLGSAAWPRTSHGRC